MISAYLVVVSVFGLVLSYLWLIHHFWLRHVFNEDQKPTVQTRIVILGGGFGGLYSALHFDKTNRVNQLLAYARQHPVIPRPAAFDSTSALPLVVSAGALTHLSPNQTNRIKL